MGAWISVMILSALGKTRLLNIPASRTAQTAQRVDISSCQCSTSHETEMDPLIAAGFHNLTCSPLCRLPEELLLDIMERLDVLSIQCLRRTSRLFLRLYSSPVFRSGHFLNGPSYFRWCQRESKVNDTWIKELKVILKRDLTDYCKDCHRRRTHQSWADENSMLTQNYLHCSGCGIDHPVCLFSKAQRSLRAETRICIGREGYVRLCQHEIITWETAIENGLQLAHGNIHYPTTPAPIHGSVDYRIIWKTAIGNGLQRVKRDIALTTAASPTAAAIHVFIGKCKHISHYPKHREKHLPSTHQPVVYPVLGISRYPDSRTHIKLMWHGHLHVPDLGFEEGYNKNATPQLMRQQLRQLRQGAAEFMIPESYPGRLLEMNCFDPNRCSCLRYAGAEQLPKGWMLTPTQGFEFHASPRNLSPGEREHPTCRSHPNKRLGALRSFEEDKQKSSSEQKQVNQSHYTGIEMMRYEPSTRAGTRIEPCPREDRCLQIHYHRSISIMPKGPYTDHIPWDWYQALDPDSYHLTNDKDSFGILWCRQPKCKNYYKYMRRTPFRKRDINRACVNPCP